MRRKFPQINKRHLQKTILNIIFNNEINTEFFCPKFTNKIKIFPTLGQAKIS